MSKRVIPSGALGARYLPQRLDHFLAYFVNTLYRIRDRQIRKMFEGATSGENLLTIDLGCGSGRPFYPSYLSKGYLIGVDVVPSFLAVLKAFYPEYYKQGRLSILIADMHQLPFKDNCADVIISESSLEHLREVEKAVTAMRDVLKVGGILILGYPLETPLLKRLVKFLLTPFWSKPGKEMTLEEFYSHPYTHKSDYVSIRKALRSHFLLLERRKIPPVMSVYEIVKMTKVE